MSAPLLKTATKRFSSLVRAIADAGYQGAATATAVRTEASIDLEFVKRSDKAKGFVLVPKRWIPPWRGPCAPSAGSGAAGDWARTSNISRPLTLAADFIEVVARPTSTRPLSPEEFAICGARPRGTTRLRH